MSNRPLSAPARWGLVAGLWVILLVLLGLLVRNFGWVTTWASGVLLGCVSLFVLVIVFSLIAAAIHLSADTIRGHYPY